MCLLLILCAGTKLSRGQGGCQGDVDTSPRDVDTSPRYSMFSWNFK